MELANELDAYVKELKTDGYQIRTELDWSIFPISNVNDILDKPIKVTLSRDDVSVHSYTTLTARSETLLQGLKSMIGFHSDIYNKILNEEGEQ